LQEANFTASAPLPVGDGFATSNAETSGSLSIAASLARSATSEPPALDDLNASGVGRGEGSAAGTVASALWLAGAPRGVPGWLFEQDAAHMRSAIAAIARRAIALDTT
jgi:hypothetical protein